MASGMDKVQKTPFQSFQFHLLVLVYPYISACHSSKWKQDVHERQAARKAGNFDPIGLPYPQTDKIQCDTHMFEGYSFKAKLKEMISVFSTFKNSVPTINPLYS